MKKESVKLLKQKNLTLKVEIKDEYAKSIPFEPIPSRNAIAIVFCYFGDSGQVSDLM